MKTNTYPLAVPSDLLKDLRKAAQLTGLSMADTMRQSMKLGLPGLVAQLSPDPLKNLKPFTPRNPSAALPPRTGNLTRSPRTAPPSPCRFRKNESVGYFQLAASWLA